MHFLERMPRAPTLHHHPPVPSTPRATSATRSKTAIASTHDLRDRRTAVRSGGGTLPGKPCAERFAFRSRTITRFSARDFTPSPADPDIGCTSLAAFDKFDWTRRTLGRDACRSRCARGSAKRSVSRDDAHPDQGARCTWPRRSSGATIQRTAATVVRRNGDRRRPPAGESRRGESAMRAILAAGTAHPTGAAG